jgi:hypothetical protein
MRSLRLDQHLTRERISDLNNDQFAVREAAMKELKGIGRMARPLLLEAARKPASTEARGRIRELLDCLSGSLTPEEIRDSRAVQALELAATADARQVLTDWAGGAPGAFLTEDAQSALLRLEKKQ